MCVRAMHFVGSYPAANAQTAMRAMIEGTNRSIDLVSDGVTPERCHPAWPDEPGPATRPREYDEVASATKARALLSELEVEYHRAFTLQVGVQHYVDASCGASPSALAPKRRDTPRARDFAVRLASRLHAIIAAIGADTVLFQIESSQALTGSFVHTDRAASRADVIPLGETVADTINRATPQARFGVHLCLPSAIRAAATVRVPAAIASAVESIADALERPEALEYVHFPLAIFEEPPSLEADAYRPLSGLCRVVPGETRLVAGFADERQPLADQVRIRGLVEDALGAPVGIAAACGLGQHTPERAERLVERMVELAGE